MNTKPSPNVVVAAVVALIMFVMAAVVGLTIARRDVAQVLYLVSALAAPTVVSLLAMLKVTAAQDQVAETNDVVKGIASQVNGKLDAKFAGVHEAIAAGAKVRVEGDIALSPPVE